MKKLLAPAFFLAFIITAAFHSNAEPGKDKPTVNVVSLGEFIYTVPLDKVVPCEELPYRWFHEYLEPHENDSVFGTLIDMVKKEQIEVFYAEYPFKEKMDSKRAKEIFLWSDSVEVELESDPGVFTIVEVINERYASEITSVTFHEQWSYDPATLTLNKTVLGIIPNLYSMEGYPHAAFYIPMNNVATADPAVVVSGITSDFITDGTTHKSWHLGDQINITVPDAKHQAEVSSRILADIAVKSQQKGTQLYQAEFPFVQKVEKQGLTEKVKGIREANMLQFYEEWEIDPRNRVFSKKVKGVIPMRETQIYSPDSSTYEWKYERSAFVPFNGYVPVKKVADSIVIDKIFYNVNYKEERTTREPVLLARDSMLIDSMAYDIREHVKRREIVSYGPKQRFGPCGPFYEPCEELSEARLKSIFATYDSVLVETLDEPIIEVREHEIGHDLTTGFRFYESWVFDYVNQTFSKETNYIGINRILLDNYGEVRATNYFNYYYKNPVTSAQQAKNAQFMIRANVVSGCLLNYVEFNNNEDDWGNKIVNYYDDWFENIPASQRYAFLQPVIEMIQNGKMKAYSTSTDVNPMTVPGFNQRLTEFAAKCSLKVQSQMEYALFNQLYFHEQWYYNLVTGQVYKEVNAITFAHRSWDVYDPETYVVEKQVETCFTIRLNPLK